MYIYTWQKLPNTPRAAIVLSLWIAREERDARKLREDWGQVRRSTPITLSSVLFLRRLSAFVLCGGLGEGIFDTLSERKCIKISYKPYSTTWATWGRTVR